MLHRFIIKIFGIIRISWLATTMVRLSGFRGSSLRRPVIVVPSSSATKAYRIIIPEVAAAGNAPWCLLWTTWSTPCQAEQRVVKE